jgi:hypothetical protein
LVAFGVRSGGDRGWSDRLGQRHCLRRRLGGVLGGRSQRRWKHVRLARLDQDAALLIARELLGVDEFFLEYG